MNYKEIPINIFINKYSKVFIKDQETFEELIKKYPELEMDLISARQNDNCSCHFKIKAFLEIKYFLDKFYLDNLFFKENLFQEYSKYDQELENKKQEQFIKNENFKKIHTINNNQKSWEEFQEFVKNNIIFKSFSVLQDGENLRIYFL